MKFRALIIGCLLPWVAVQLYAQAELLRVIQPSPTVASLARYGDVPVSNYTGKVDVSVPLYEIKTSDFSLPISLSYNAGGIRVEEMASWVGLGWSLNAGGIVSRTQRGKPDESNGYMDPTYKVSEVMAMESSTRENYLGGVAHLPGNDDLEPDLFFFNFGSYSGKFFYNQETEKFVCIPQSKLKIDKDYFLLQGKWHITAEDGTEFYFDLKEQNTSTSQCGGSGGPPSVSTTGWFLTKVITPSAREEITLQYETATYTVKNLSTQSLNHPVLSTCGDIPPSTFCESQNAYNGYRLTSITYPTGKVDFVSNTARYDQLNDERLDRIDVYTNFGSSYELLKKFVFTYNYFNEGNLTVPGLTAEQRSYLVRLKLVSVKEVAADNAELPPYVFEYNEQHELPSRHSNAQDNWGFYNGKNSNQNLVPPLRMGTLYYPGADRSVDTTYTSMAVLKKITYPTGGETELFYENHTVNGYVPYAANDGYTPRVVSLDTTNVCDPNNPNPIFCESFTVNGGTTYNGGYLTIRVTEIFNCNHCPEATTCAVMMIVGENFSLPITCDVDNIYLPPGEYTLTANFTLASSPSDYENFAITLSWTEFNIQSSPNFRIGGLRAKKVRMKDGLGNSTTRHFKYEMYEGYSSGVIVTSEPVYEYVRFCSGGLDDMQGQYLVRTSTSNLPLGLTQGSHVGYGTVAVTTEGAENGKSVYHYTTANQMQDIFYQNSIPAFASTGMAFQYPFLPVGSAEHRRGVLVKQEDYIKSGNDFVKQRVSTFDYDPFNEPMELSNQVMREAAAGIQCSPWGTAGNPYAIWGRYEVISEWVRPVKQTVQFFNLDGSVAYETITTTEYSNTNHLKATKVISTGSDGAVSTTYSRYPLDYTVPAGTTNTAAKGIKQLQDGNFISPVIEQYTTLKKPTDTEEKVVQSVVTVFDENKPLPREIYVTPLATSRNLSSYTVSTVNGSGVFVSDHALEKRIEYLQYDTRGNLLQQRKSDNISSGYSWAYKSSYPIMEVINANASDVFYTSFEDNTTNISTTARTGTKSYNTSYTVNIPGSGSRKLTYWKKVGTGAWEFVETTISTSTVIGGANTLIDEVRVYPAGALMTTYTYKPGFGISSVTDANNLITYYEYDSFGRLKLIRDDGNILKTFEYKYKTPGQGQQ